MNTKLFLVEFGYHSEYSLHPKNNFCIIKAKTKDDAIEIARRLRTTSSLIAEPIVPATRIDRIENIIEIDLDSNSEGMIYCSDSSVIYDTTEEERLYEILLTLNEIINNLLAQSSEYITPEDNERLKILFPDSKNKFESMERFELITILSEKSINIANRYKKLQVEVSDACCDITGIHVTAY